MDYFFFLVLILHEDTICQDTLFALHVQSTWAG